MASSFQGLEVVLGVTGGIAAYKAVDLASQLAAEGACVHCILTENACQLVSPRSFEAVTGRPVFTSLWVQPEEFRIGHVTLADRAKLVIVAPATANILAKSAIGLCDDLLSTTLCAAWEKPTLVAPAMNDRMWANPAVQRNVEILRQRGWRFVGPNIGRLACGREGPGRMAEPAEILDAVRALGTTPPS
jgi:phosphopantothenoylcysteine decarboxylase/phosphopantothenate--cysteine ligase